MLTSHQLRSGNPYIRHDPSRPLQFVSGDLCGVYALQQVIYFPLGEETADLTGMVRDTIRLSHSAKVHRLNLACFMSNNIGHIVKNTGHIMNDFVVPFRGGHFSVRY